VPPPLLLLHPLHLLLRKLPLLLRKLPLRLRKLPLRLPMLVTLLRSKHFFISDQAFGKAEASWPTLAISDDF
jgi:hypothetical protein